MDYQIRPIWNVIATIPGTVEPDRWVMIGNHRDAWVYGAVDPSSGTAATLEMCRALGEAVKHGWKPRRTLVYASWDAEEYGLVGSTEWAEEHAEEVQKKAVLMLNVDSAVAGRSSPSAVFLRCVTSCSKRPGRSNDVRSGRSLGSIWTEAQREAWASSSPLVIRRSDLDDWRHLHSGRNRPSSPEFVPQMHAGSAPAPTTPRSSITWASRRSTAA